MKEEILTILKENRHKYISGEYLSCVFGVSRSAIWKAIKQYGITENRYYVVLLAYIILKKYHLQMTMLKN